MAANSGLFVPNHIDVYDATQLAIDLVSDTRKFALFTNTLTPNFSAAAVYGTSPYDANEVSGTGYSAGGATLGSKTVTESPSGTMMVDVADPAWTTATFSSARQALDYDSTTASKGLCNVNFGADFSVTAGTLTVQVSASGLWYVDWTP